MQLRSEVAEAAASSFRDMPQHSMLRMGISSRRLQPWRVQTLPESLFIACLGTMIGFGGALFFYLMVKHRVATDLDAHLQMVELSLKYHSWPPNFLYYWTVAACAGFSAELNRLQNASIFVLGCSCALRFFVSVWVGRQLLGEVPGWTERSGLRYGFYIVTALLQVAHNVIDIYKNSPYLGYFPPNVWHNSTMIFLMPWAILLFYWAYRVITRCKWTDLLMFALVGVINVAIKNSLIQVLAVAVPIAAILGQRSFRGWVKIGLALIPPLAFVATQAALIYGDRFAGSVLARYHEQAGVSGESRVAFEFLALWPPHTLSTIICSFLYPLVAMAALRGRLTRHPLFAFAAGCLVVALLQYMCLVETGYRRLHGNFTWQVLICTYMLFLSIIVIQFRQLLCQEHAEERDMIPAVPFAVHVLSGLAYIAIIFASGNFAGS